MKQILNAYKPKGLTPLEVIKLIRQKYPSLKDKKIGYAGRLDPLAHGVLLLMIGETAKEKDKYLNLPKEYELEAVFGVSTDTYDTLGLLQNTPVIARSVNDEAIPSVMRLPRSFSVARNDVEVFIKSKLGKQTQSYPPYSSKTVAGKPLFWWAKNNKLSEIEIPKREIEIYDFKLLETKKISSEKLKKEIMQQINSVKGDFRQEEIKERWKIYFTTNYQLLTTHQIARFKISCSSGTYIRSLVNELGENLGTSAIALEILRTKVGEYSLSTSIKLF